MARKLTTSQRVLLNSIIAETMASGPPTQKRISQITGLINPWRSLVTLERRGYLEQLHPGGAWRPLFTPSGHQILHTMIVLPHGLSLERAQEIIDEIFEE